MKLNRRSLLLATLAASAVAGCSGTAATSDPAEPAALHVGSGEYSPGAVTGPLVDAAVAASYRTSWSLLGLDAEPDNRLISPASLMAGMAMVGLGAVDASKADLERLFDMELTELAEGISGLREALAAYESLPASVDANEPPTSPIVHIASRVAAISKRPKQPFLDAIKRFFNANVAEVDRAAAQANLDAWVNEHTAGLIPKSAITVTDDTVLVIQDALLFAAAWQQAFKNDNIEMSFTKADGSVMTTSTLTDNFTLPAATTSRWAAARLPYDNALALDLIVPAPDVHPLDLSVEELIEIDRTLRETPAGPVFVQVPPCDLAGELDLRAGLDSLGVDLTHFDNIIEDGAVGQARQQIRLQVSAKGTVGAAVTEVEVVELSAPLDDPEKALEVIANRPYLMRVLHTPTGWPLFLAVASEPEPTS